MKSSRVVDLTRRKNERGGVVAYTVMSALFLFLAVGLGVDLSHLYTVKAELQNAADAAALAGCTPLDEPDAAKIEEAVDRAIVVLNENKYNFNNRQFVEGDNLTADDLTSLRQYVRFAVNLSDFDTGNGLSEADASANPTNIRFVRVVTPDVPISIFFSVPILGALRDMSARAVAGYSVPGNTSFCIVPLTAVQCNPGDTNCKLGCNKVDDPNCLEDNTQFWGFCPGTDPYALQDIQEGELDPDGNGTCDPKREFCKRCAYTIRAAPSDGPSAGNFNALTCAGRGACQLRMALAAAGNCQCTASPGEELEVDTEPGMNAGPVRQGLNVRFDEYTACDPAVDPLCVPGCDTNPSDHPPDTNIHQGTNIATKGPPVFSGINWTQYSAGSPFQAPSNPGQANRRVLILPITPIGQFGDPKDGRELVQPSGFGGFFMQRAVTKGTGSEDGNIRVEYIADDIIDVIGFDPNGPNTTNVVTPVLYR